METLNKIKEELMAIATKVQSDDKKEAAAFLQTHVFTIYRYLNGDVRKESFGLQLLSFLKEKLAKREQLLQNLIEE